MYSEVMENTKKQFRKPLICDLEVNYIGLNSMFGFLHVDYQLAWGKLNNSSSFIVCVLKLIAFKVKDVNTSTKK